MPNITIYRDDAERIAELLRTLRGMLTPDDMVRTPVDEEREAVVKDAERLADLMLARVASGGCHPRRPILCNWCREVVPGPCQNALEMTQCTIVRGARNSR